MRNKLRRRFVYNRGFVHSTIEFDPDKDCANKPQEVVKKVIPQQAQAAVFPKEVKRRRILEVQEEIRILEFKFERFNQRILELAQDPLQAAQQLPQITADRRQFLEEKRTLVQKLQREKDKNSQLEQEIQKLGKLTELLPLKILQEAANQGRQPVQDQKVEVPEQEEVDPIALQLQRLFQQAPKLTSRNVLKEYEEITTRIGQFDSMCLLIISGQEGIQLPQEAVFEAEIQYLNTRKEQISTVLKQNKYEDQAMLLGLSEIDPDRIEKTRQRIKNENGSGKNEVQLQTLSQLQGFADYLGLDVRAIFDEVQRSPETLKKSLSPMVKEEAVENVVGLISRGNPFLEISMKFYVEFHIQEEDIRQLFYAVVSKKDFANLTDMQKKEFLKNTLAVHNQKRIKGTQVPEHAYDMIVEAFKEDAPIGQWLTYVKQNVLERCDEEEALETLRIVVNAGMRQAITPIRAERYQRQMQALNENFLHQQSRGGGNCFYLSYFAGICHSLLKKKLRDGQGGAIRQFMYDLENRPGFKQYLQESGNIEVLNKTLEVLDDLDRNSSIEYLNENIDLATFF